MTATTTAKAAPVAKEVITPERSIAGLRVEKIKDRPVYLNMLIYGEPGVGKTRLAGTADDVPEMRKVLFVDVEGGTFTLRQSNPNVDVVRVTKWSEIADLYTELLRGQHDYQTVVVDSLTEIQKFAMYEIMRELMDKDPDRDPDIPSMREWGKNIEVTRKFVRGFRDLPVNTIFTALAKSDKDVKRGVTTKKPYLSGKLADEIAGFLDVVVYMYVKEDKEEVKRLLLSGTTEEFVAKDRSGQLPLVIENPSMKTLFETLHTKDK